MKIPQFRLCEFLLSVLVLAFIIRLCVSANGWITAFSLPVFLLYLSALAILRGWGVPPAVTYLFCAIWSAMAIAGFWFFVDFVLLSALG